MGSINLNPSTNFSPNPNTNTDTNPSKRCIFHILTWHSTKHGLDWTVGLDWTGQLDWTGLILIYIFKCFHSRKFYVQIYTGNILGWPFVSKWVRDICALIQCIFFYKTL